MTTGRLFFEFSRSLPALALVTSVAMTWSGQAAYATTLGVVETWQEAESGVTSPASPNNPNRNFYGSTAVAMTPNGEYVYLAAKGDSLVTAFRRDAATGQLTQVDVLNKVDPNNVFSLNRLVEVNQVITSPDGKYIYLVGFANQGRSAFDDPRIVGYVRNVDPATKVVTHAAIGGLGSSQTSVVAGFGSGGSRFAMSPDGMAMYYVYTGAKGLFVFHRNVTDGFIHALDAYKSDSATPTAIIDDLPNPRDVATSPDGMHVYVVGNQAKTGQGGDIVVLSRDMTTGKLTPLISYKQSDAGLTALDDPRAVAVSADGKFLYTANANSHTVAVFARATDGTLSFVDASAYVDTATGKDVLAGAQSISLSADGKFAYVGSETTQSVAVFSRDNANGKLTAYGFEANGVGGVTLGNVKATALSADGKNLYTVSQNAVEGMTVFGTTQDVGVSLTSDKSNVAPGETVMYTITVSNTGVSDARNVTASFSLPVGASVTAFDGAAAGLQCVTAAAVVTCAIDQLSVNQSLSATVTVVAPASDGSFLAQADVAATSPSDAATANNHAAVAVTVTSPVAVVPPVTEPAPVVAPPASSDAGTTLPTANPPTVADNNNAAPGAPAGSDGATGNQDANNPVPSGDSSAAPADNNNVSAPVDSGGGSGGGGGAFGLAALWLLLGRGLSRRRAMKLA